MRKLIRQVRRIDRALTTHIYQGVLYTEFDDGTMTVSIIELKIDQTRVRMKDKRSKWEEYIPGCYGWFGCEPQYQVAVIAA